MTGIPWKLIGIVAGAAAVAAILWWTQSRIRISYQAEQQRDASIATHAAYKAAVQEGAAVWTAKFQRDHEADVALNTEVERLETERASLDRATDTKKPSVEKTDANGVTRLSINPDWWLCVSTFVSRIPADAAACEADPSTGSLPNPVSR